MWMKSQLPLRPTAPPRHRIVLLTWVGIYPTITLLLWCVPAALVERLPLPLMTLLVTAVAVPLMSYVVMPILGRTFARWLDEDPAENRATHDIEPPSAPSAASERARGTGPARRLLT